MILNSSFSQENVDSLKIKLHLSKNTEDSISAFLSEAFNNTAVNPDVAINLADQAYLKSKKINYKKGMGVSFSRKGMAYLSKYKMDLAISNFNYALNLIEKENDYEVARVYSGIASCYSYKHDYVNALEYFIKCKDLLEKLKEYKKMVSPLLNISQIYLEYYKLDEAHKYIKNTMEIAKKSNDQRGLITSYYCLGKYNLIKKDYNQAIKNFNYSLKYNKKNEYKIFYSFALWGKGVSYDSLFNIKKAFDYYNLTLDFSRNNNINEGVNNALGSLCNWYVATKNYKKAIEVGLKYFESDYYKASQGVSFSVARAYENTGNYKEAYRFSRIFIENNLLSSADLNVKLNALVFTNEVKKRENDLILSKLKIENESNKYKMKTRFWLFLFFIGLLSLMIIVIFIYSKHKIKLQKAKLQQLELNAQIFAKESEIELKKKEMKIKNIEMEKLAIYISEKNTFLEDFKGIVDNLKKSKGIEDREEIFKKLISFTSEKFSLTEERHEFNLYINNQYNEFLMNLAMQYPQLNEYDKRLAALLKLNYNTKEIASILNISIKGVQAQRYKLRKRLEISEDISLNEFFSNF
jgi:DNA-binding CsgD family transcriptional regulator